MSDDPVELTPEEQEILAEAPADTTLVPGDEGGEEGGTE
jgi:hypothetical protein